MQVFKLKNKQTKKKNFQPLLSAEQIVLRTTRETINCVNSNNCMNDQR